MGHGQFERNSRFVQYAVPTLHTGDTVFDVVVAQHFVQGVQHGYFFFNQFSIDDVQNFVRLATQLVVVGAFTFFVTAFQSAAVKNGGVAGLVGTKQVDRDAVVEVDVTLDGGQVDHPGGAQFLHVVGF